MHDFHPKALGIKLFESKLPIYGFVYYCYVFWRDVFKANNSESLKGTLYIVRKYEQI